MLTEIVCIIDRSGSMQAIDAECSRRAGNVSRNTWITEAVQEKLARNGAASQSTSAGEGA